MLPTSTFVYSAGISTDMVSPLFIKTVCNSAVPDTFNIAVDGNFIIFPDAVVTLIRNPAQVLISAKPLLCTYTKASPLAVAVYVAIVTSLLVLDSVAFIERTTSLCSQFNSVE